jgi:hypothetical protein
MGSLFGGTVKDNSAIQQGNGPVQAVGQDQALKIANDRLPAYSASNLPVPVVSHDGSLQMEAPSAPQQATKIVTPTAQQAVQQQGFLSPALTTKGKVLSGLLQLGQGAALGAGQRTFSQGFENAQQFPAEMARREAQNKLMQQEEILKANEAAQQPLIFASTLAKNNAATKESLSQADLNAIHGKNYEALIGKRGQTVQDRMEQANAAGLQPGTPEYNKVVYGDALQPKVPNSEAGLAVQAAGTGPKAEQAKAALGILTNNKLKVKGAPSGASSNSAKLTNDQNLTVQQTVAHYLQAANGDPDAAQNQFNQILPSVLEKNPEMAALVPEIRKGFKSNKRINTTNTKPALNFKNSTPGN